MRRNAQFTVSTCGVPFKGFQDYYHIHIVRGALFPQPSKTAKNFRGSPRLLLNGVGAGAARSRLSPCSPQLGPATSLTRAYRTGSLLTSKTDSWSLSYPTGLYTARDAVSTTDTQHSSRIEPLGSRRSKLRTGGEPRSQRSLATGE